MGHLLAVSVGFTLAASVVTRLIQVDRGIDLTDEMMYLLAATSEPSSFIHSPWGWHTAPLLELTGGDVASLRVVGAVVLGLAATLLTLVARAGLRRSSETGSRSRTSTLESGILAVGAMFWSSLFYIGMLRTPGHNWVAIVGLLVATAGLVSTRSWSETNSKWIGPLLIAGGAVIVLPARPLAVVPIGVVVLLEVWWARSGLHGFDLLARVFIASVAIVVALVLIGIWPSSAIQDFLRAATTPELVEKSGLLGALRNYVAWPAEWLRILQRVVPASTTLGFGALLLLATGIAWRLRRPRSVEEGFGRSVRLLLAVAPVLALTVAGAVLAARPSLGGVAYASPPWGAASVSGVVLAMLVVGIFGSRGGRASPITVGLICLWLAVAGGIGTAGNLVGTSGNGLGLMALAILVAAWATVHPTLRDHVAVSVVWSLCGVVVAGALLSAGTNQPYRMAALERQAIEMDVLSGKILVDDVTARRFRELRELAARSGFEPGDRVIPLTLPWSSFPPAALDAARMPTLMPTVFGNEGSVAMADFNLSLLSGTWSDAWIIVDSTRNDELYRRLGGQIREVEELIARATGREFPSEYSCIASGDFYQLWLPSDGLPNACSYSDPVPDVG